MDERKAQLKTLKKAYNQDKRKYVTLWKVLGILLLVLAILFGVVTVLLTVDNLVADRLLKILPELPRGGASAAIVSAVRQAAGYMGFEIGVAEHPLLWSAIWGLASTAFLLLFIIVLPMWGRGVRKFRKTRGYLDYKTMKKACREEK